MVAEGHQLVTRFLRFYLLVLKVQNGDNQDLKGRSHEHLRGSESDQLDFGLVPWSDAKLNELIRLLDTEIEEDYGEVVPKHLHLLVLGDDANNGLLHEVVHQNEKVLDGQDLTF